MSHAPVPSIRCTHPWHQCPETPYCFACGARKDGQVSLAGLTIGRMAGLLTLKNLETGCVISGFLQFDGYPKISVLVDGRGVIQIEDPHEWVLHE